MILLQIFIERILMIDNYWRIRVKKLRILLFLMLNIFTNYFLRITLINILKIVDNL